MGAQSFKQHYWSFLYIDYAEPTEASDSGKAIITAMETKWLEDFVSLAETRSFSRSAQLRHVTQPAFSRRIQALEAWAGTDLVDRSSYPTRLTSAGKTMYDQALEMLQSLQSTRSMLRAHSSSDKGMVGFAVPHTLAFTFFPSWVSQVQEQFGSFKSRLIALNVHDAVMRLVEGGCDLLIAYHHSSQPFQLDSSRYEMVRLGEELLAPYAKPDAKGQPMFMLPGTAAEPLAVPGLWAWSLFGALDGVAPQRSRHAGAPGACLRNRYGRRPESHGDRGAWRGIPAV